MLAFYIAGHVLIRQMKNQSQKMERNKLQIKIDLSFQNFFFNFYLFLTLHLN